MSNLNQPSPVVINLCGNQRLYDCEARRYRGLIDPCRLKTG